ncbi:5-hydroxytryptamine receptor 3E [Sciurus carolinensis]|uniref:5-hydroxytryptamine receptor 3E n=1 Tax=Sciurus carolinensis TaxID=30640 RepID=A0AA41MZZ8_SCICA|nr:5-hydroxytryptamine receptor 3E [Sciurus carolinensis]
MAAAMCNQTCWTMTVDFQAMAGTGDLLAVCRRSAGYWWIIGGPRVISTCVLYHAIAEDYDIETENNSSESLQDQTDEEPPAKLCKILDNTQTLNVTAQQKWPLLRASSSGLCKCELCEFDSKYFSDLKQHMILKHKRTDSNVCRVCKESFSTNMLLIEHAKLHEEDPYICKYCDYRTVIFENLSQHIADTHFSDHLYWCEQCDMQYETHPIVAKFPPTFAITLSHTYWIQVLLGWGSTFTINCSEYGPHGVDETVLDSTFDRKFHSVINFIVPIHVNISLRISAILDVLGKTLNTDIIMTFYEANPHRKEKLKNLQQCMDVDKTPRGLTALVSNEDRIRYKKFIRVTSICNLDIFYFPFDQQNCTLTFNSFLYTVNNMVLGVEKEGWERTDKFQDTVQVHGEWELLSIKKAIPEISKATKLYDQIMFYVAIRRRPRLYVINLLVPSGFLVAIDTLSFYPPAPFKMTFLLGYGIFLLMMNDLLSVSGSPLIRLKEPVDLVGKVPGPRETEPNGCPESARAQWELEAQKQSLVELWVEFSHLMDTLLFHLYLLFMASSVITVIALWNT